MSATTTGKRIQRSAAAATAQTALENAPSKPKAYRVPRRLNLNLSQQAYADAVDLSEQTSRSLTELVRLGLGLVKVAVEESRKKNKLIVTTEEGRPIKELVLPGL